MKPTLASAAGSANVLKRFKSCTYGCCQRRVQSGIGGEQKAEGRPQNHNLLPLHLGSCSP
jgi:hypothetical protein